MRKPGETGGAMILVMLLLSLVSVLSLGLLNVVQIRSRSSLRDAAYVTAQERARSIHQSICSRIREGSGPVAEAVSQEEDILYGEGEADDLKVEMMITAMPQEEMAEVVTEVECGSYHFSFVSRVET